MSPDEAVTATRAANQTYFPALDGIRAMAFLMVFGQHYLAMPWGWGGVDVFFVLSGLLITGILFDTQHQPDRVRSFYIRRTLRIFPLYYGVMLLLVLTYPEFRWQWDWKWLIWPAYLGNFARGIHPFIQESAMQRLADFQLLSRVLHDIPLLLGHCWSLCVEEQFYLIWPWVVFGVRDRRKLMWICLFFIVVCPLMRIVANQTLPQFMLDQEVLYRWTPFRIDALLLGGLVALVRRGPSRRALLISARAGFALLSAVWLLWVNFSPRTQHGPDGSHIYPSWHFTWGLTFIDLLSACLIVMVLESGSVFFSIFNWGPLRWIGRISYGAYVYHDIPRFLIMGAVMKYAWHGGVVIPGVTKVPPVIDTWTAVSGLAFTLIVSALSFRYFETPFIRLKERWARPSRDIRSG